MTDSWPRHATLDRRTIYRRCLLFYVSLALPGAGPPRLTQPLDQFAPRQQCMSSPGGIYDLWRGPVGAVPSSTGWGGINKKPSVFFVTL
jgi:hypothetical protein